MKGIKKVFSKIGGFFKKPFKWIKRIHEEPAIILTKGRPGGMILCAVLGAQFLFGLIFRDLMSNSFALIPFLVSLIVVSIASELGSLLIRLVFRGKSRSRNYFLTSFLILLICNLVGNQGNCIVPAVIMSFAVSVSVDIAGRFVWGMLNSKNFKCTLAYVDFAVAALVIGLFAFFYNTDKFGESRVEFYQAAVPSDMTEDCAEFKEMLSKGTYTVKTASYGPENADIITKTSDLSNISVIDGISSKVSAMFSDYELEKAPIAGKMYYPKGALGCPVLFMVHGMHEDSVPSYLGYDYLCEYLASHGYVVVSVDENIINSLDVGNNARAVLLLENIKAITALTKDQKSDYYKLIDLNNIAIAGHSRGGEMVATAYEFNNLEAYPDNGNVSFDYHFNIKTVIAIAPTVDQYMPAGRAVQIEDVNYLLIHGSNDQDVSLMMGEKQYNNVHFTNSDEFNCKASVYILGANHGQFNSLWGRYDMNEGTNGFLNTYNFISEADQQLIAKAYFKVFLDMTLKEDFTYADLLTDNCKYLKYLPKTAYITNYMDSDDIRLCSFDNNVDLKHGEAEIQCYGMNRWATKLDVYGNGGERENIVLDCFWEADNEPQAVIKLDSVDITNDKLSFRLADKREDISDVASELYYEVKLTDIKGNTVSVETPVYVYPSLALQLYKQDVMFNTYEYKHQLQTVRVAKESFSDVGDFDFSNVVKLTVSFDGKETGEVIIDDLCIMR